MTNHTVASLRKAKNKVRVIHSRYMGKALMPTVEIEKNFGNKKDVSGKGGKTVVQITTPEGKELEGIAECSVKDSFNRRRGLHIAIARALAEF